MEVAYSRYNSGICLEEPRKTTKNLRIDGVPVRIRAEHHPNISPQYCRHSNLLSDTVRVETMEQFYMTKRTTKLKHRIRA
jgi:hypothetical protein